MLKIRIIPTLLLRKGRMVKGKQFDNYRDTGDPISASRIYNAQYVDELVFLDIDATNEQRPTNIDIIAKVAQECFMPLTIGGGISSCEQIRELLKAGADKVVINSAALANPDLVEEAAYIFGSQCVVVGIDLRKEEDQYVIYSHSGKKRNEIDLLTYLATMEKKGAGEFFINSIDQDGMMNGYDLELFRLVKQNVDIPIIMSGGIGNFMHLVNAVQAGVMALSMASIYHFSDNTPIRARSYLRNNQIDVKNI